MSFNYVPRWADWWPLRPMWMRFWRRHIWFHATAQQDAEADERAAVENERRAKRTADLVDQHGPFDLVDDDLSVDELIAGESVDVSFQLTQKGNLDLTKEAVLAMLPVGTEVLLKLWDDDNVQIDRGRQMSLQFDTIGDSVVVNAERISFGPWDGEDGKRVATLTAQFIRPDESVEVV